MTNAVKEASDLIVDGLNITERVAEIEDRGFTVIPNFITPDEVARIRHAFDTEVRITVARGLGVSGRTWRAHNLLAKTRAVDYLFLDSRVRALVEGVLGKYTQICGPRRSSYSPYREKLRVNCQRNSSACSATTVGLGVDGRHPLDVLKDGVVINPTAKPASQHRN